MRVASINTAFITTVKNDSDGVDLLLGSLMYQSVMPNEIIIVDAKSNDETVKKIKDFEKEFKKKFPKIKFKLLIKKGNRSVGRNLAIKNTSSDIILASDAGCILDKKWAEIMMKAFKDKSVDVVAGFYKPKTRSIFEKSLAAYTCVMQDKVTNDFLPSSRSVGFRKDVWKKSGGYPENLDTCEDLFFAKKLKKMDFKFKVQKNAYVYWPQRKNLYAAFKQFFSYATGDGKAFYIRRNTPFLFLRVILFVLLFYFALHKIMALAFVFLLLIIIYIIWTINKNYKYINNVKAFIYLPLLQISSDIAVFCGMLNGILDKIVEYYE